MFLFYEIGRIFHMKGWFHKRVHLIAPLVVIVLYTAFIHIVLPAVDIKHNDYPIYLPLMALPMMWALYQISKTIEANAAQFIKNRLSHYGRSSLVLFGLHQPLWIIMFPLASRISYLWVQPLFLVIPTIPILLYTEKLISRYCPILLGKRGNKIQTK